MKQHYSLAKRLIIFSLLACSFYTGSAQVYTVNSILDDGSPGTLRDAITQVNGGTFNTINFNFSALGAAPYTITLTGSLPTIVSPVVIDGYSEPASVAGTISGRTISVQVNGNGAAATGLTIGTSDVVVDGLAIYKCTTYGINILSGFNNMLIWGNYIGTDATGLGASMGNGNTGIFINSFGAGSANTGLIIGTDGDGTSDANEGNLIVSNGAGGATDGGIAAFFTTGSKFSGNIVGLGKDGATTTNLFNNGTGILLADRSTGNTIGTEGDGNSDALEGNNFSNNGKSGIWLFSKSNTNRISGNVVGLTSAGANALNVSFGIIIDNCSDNIIGTNADGVSDLLEKNFVANNLSGGIQIKSGNIGSGFDQNTNNNIVAGNAIGVALDGTTAAGNAGNGIELASLTGFQTDNNIIGSDGSGTNEAVKGNIIANQSGSGISMQDASNTNLVTGNRISKNSIYNNLVSAINYINPGAIGSTGITANQAGGFSLGPNSLLNAPVITSVTNDPLNIIFNGFARPGATLEFYLSDKGATSPAPPSGLTKNFGQGKRFLFQAVQGGTLNGITDAGTNVAGSYTTADQGTSSGASPITSDFTFSYSVPAGNIGIIGGTYTFTALAIDGANTSGSVNNTSSFGGGIDATITVLPITLLDFSAHKSGNDVTLLWSTSFELNNSYFSIERSADGKSFAAIGRVEGQGNSNLVTSYTYTDGHPLAGVGYYRLRQVDLDGKSSYSKILSLRSDAAVNIVSLYPSPFHDNLNISINSPSDDKLVVLLMDQSGKIVRTHSLTATKGINSFSLNSGMQSLVPGMYYIKISGKTLNFSQKLLKE